MTAILSVSLIFPVLELRHLIFLSIHSPLKKLIDDNDLTPVVFPSFRHFIITCKLKLNGGDMKSVQGDSGHAQVKMAALLKSLAKNL